MTQPVLYALAGVAIFTLSLYALIARRDLLRRMVAANTMAAGVFLVFIAMAARQPPEAPDPVPHAMVLTGLVVSISATALGLALVRAVHAATGATRLAEDRADEPLHGAGD